MADWGDTMVGIFRLIGMRYTVFVIAVCLCCGAIVGCRPGAPTVVVPENLDQLEPQLKSYLAQHIESVRRVPDDRERWRTLALVYEANQMWTEAGSCFSRLAELSPHEPRALLHLTVVILAAGDLDKGVELLEELSERFPDFGPGIHRLGVELLAGGEVAGAVEAFERVTEIAPASPRGFVGLASARLRSGDAAGAIDLLERALEIEPRDRPAHWALGNALLQLGRMDEAEVELARGSGAGQAHLIDEWSLELPIHAKTLPRQMARAQAYIGVGRVREAIAMYDVMLTWNPDNPDVMNNKALAHKRGGEIDTAREILLKAIEVDPERWVTRVNLAYCELAAEEPEKALERAEEAVARGPEIADAHRAQGRCLMALNRNQEAHTALSRAVELDPGNTTSRSMLAAVCRRLGRTEEARDQLEQLIKVNPAGIGARLELSAVCLELGDFEGATTAVEGARRFAPENPRVLEAAARVNEAAGNRG